MASVNKVIVVGNLGRDPETRYSPDGAAITNVAIATSRVWKDKHRGDRKEETEWHRVVFFGRLAEVASEYLKKGRPAYVEGRLRTRKWEDKEGIERYTTEIVAEDLQLLSGGREETGGRQSSTRNDDSNTTRDRSTSQERPARPAPAARSFEDMDDDIPF